MVDKSVHEQIAFIKAVKEKYGLSCEKICDVVSHSGGFASVNTVRRLTAPGAESKRFRYETITPIYEALLTAYSDDAPAENDLPTHLYPYYDRSQYERHISMLSGQVKKLMAETAEQKAVIEKQSKIIEILWHGLVTFGESKEGYAEILKYVLKGGVKHG